jgi:ACS family D-galactonate transporter-like MFS transporter
MVTRPQGEDLLARHGTGVDEIPTRRRFSVMWMLFVCVVINYLDRSNLSIVAPKLTEELHLSPVALGTILSAFGWTYALFQVPASRFVDRVNPRMLFAIALALWSLATLLMGFVGTFIALVGLRLAVGATEAPAYPINNRVVTTWFPERERAGAIGFYTSGQFVGLAFLTPILAWLVAHYGWRFIFCATGAVGIVWAGIWWLLYRDPAAMSGVNQAELRLIEEGGGIPELSRKLEESPSTSVWRDLRFVLSRRKLWGLYIGQFGIVAIQWFFLTWFPVYLVRYRHIELAKAGFLASLPFLGAFIGVILGGVLSDFLLRHGMGVTLSRKIPVVMGLLLASCIFLANWCDDPRLIVACMTCSFFGSGFASITWCIVSTVAPERLIGLTGGVFNFISNCAAFVVPMVIGLLIKGGSFTGASFSRPLMFISSMGAMGVFSYVFVVGKIERIQE